jgi:hypothetical protein
MPLQTSDVGPQRLDEARQAAIRGLVASVEDASDSHRFDAPARAHYRALAVEWAQIALALDRVECVQ